MASLVTQEGLGRAMWAESLGLLWTACPEQPEDTLSVCLCSIFKAFQTPPLLGLLGQKGCPCTCLLPRFRCERVGSSPPVGTIISQGRHDPVFCFLT